jgi:hypothetical protein
MKIRSILLTAGSILLGACSGGGGGMDGGGGGGGSGSANLSLRATDTPFVHDLVQEATISIDRITIHHQSNSDGDPVVLYEGAPIDMVLTNLRDGVSQFLGQHDLEAGTYRQIRLRVSHASLTLVNGNVYSTDDGTIHLSSQGTSGFKVFLDPPLELAEGTSAGLMLDFDLPKTFHPIPSNDPLNADRFNLHPVIHAADLSLTGGIEGTVTQDDGQGGFTPVADATVFVLPPGVTDPAESVASSPTGADGHYTILGVEPGTYDVLATKGDLQATVTGVNVVAGPATVVDLVLPANPVGGIAGVVSQDDGTGTLVPVPGATVLVLPPGVTDPTMAFATGTTDAAGAYSFAHLVPGTYDVHAELLPAAGTAASVVVVAEAVTTADIVIQ